jgi:hypothetical protein
MVCRSILWHAGLSSSSEKTILFIVMHNTGSVHNNGCHWDVDSGGYRDFKVCRSILSRSILCHDGLSSSSEKTILFVVLHETGSVHSNGCHWNVDSGGYRGLKAMPVYSMPVHRTASSSYEKAILFIVMHNTGSVHNNGCHWDVDSGGYRDFKVCRSILSRSILCHDGLSSSSEKTILFVVLHETGSVHCNGCHWHVDRGGYRGFNVCRSILSRSSMPVNVESRSIILPLQSVPVNNMQCTAWFI